MRRITHLIIAFLVGYAVHSYLNYFVRTIKLNRVTNCFLKLSSQATNEDRLACIDSYKSQGLENLVLPFE